MKNIGGKLLLLIVIAAIAWIVWTALKPIPIKVEIAKSTRGALQVTINAEGKTRVHDRFTVAAPVSGRLTRIGLHRGDYVIKGAFLLRIEPMPLAPLDQRQYREAVARVDAAQAARQQVETAIEHAETDYQQAKRELLRAEHLSKTGDISQQDLERYKNIEQAAAKEVDGTKFKLQAAKAEVEAAQAALLVFEQGEENSKAAAIELHAPIAGKVLHIFEESERVVAAGTPILELSNPLQLEIVIDLLSSDAVKVLPGQLVIVENWGGEKALQARVRLVEPSAFTKISALGVEEQRVNVIADFVEPVEKLGDGFRVETKIVIWESVDVLKVPTSALFRQGQNWALFVVEKGKALERKVQVGHKSNFEVEILQGLSPETEVILHPSNQIQNGVLVE
ncbi:MAG: efflux RND transporter periplasmic adaptor subunit [Blastocatellia bacterium]|nr:efflux RND transporter periplasmic adaptor subunit [Blastocatellia bacterium]